MPHLPGGTYRVTNSAFNKLIGVGRAAPGIVGAMPVEAVSEAGDPHSVVVRTCFPLYLEMATQKLAVHA